MQTIHRTRWGVTASTILALLLASVGCQPHVAPAELSADQPICAPGAPCITDPGQAERVEGIIAVSGTLAAPVPPGRFLSVLVLPDPNGTGQSYWVQQTPVVTGLTWHTAEAHIGQRGNSGMEFRLCSLLADQAYAPGTSMGVLPTGPAHCVNITRR